MAHVGIQRCEGAELELKLRRKAEGEALTKTKRRMAMYRPGPQDVQHVMLSLKMWQRKVRYAWSDRGHSRTGAANQAAV